MKYTFRDLQKMKRPTVKGNSFIFNENTADWEFINLADNGNLEELRFDTPQDKLRYLDASRCNIKKITFTAGCMKLQSLYLHHNKLSQFEIPFELPELELLDLSFNEELTALNFTRSFPKLNYLYLHQCNIINLEQFTRYFKQPGFDFNIEGNKNIQSPPVEIVEKGKEAVIDWFKASKKELNEVKVILIGEAKAGKTSLLRRLKNNTFNPIEEQTDGIIIEAFEFKNLSTFKKQKKLHGIKAYFWDFGGQEIMSSTHEFFMTKRSVYLLVLETRKDVKLEGQIRDWIKRIEIFGDLSPVIVVINKIDLNPGFGLDTYNLKKELPQIKGFMSISCDKDTGIFELKQLLEEVIPQADLFHTKIDEKWFPIKTRLQEITAEKQYITQHEFVGICKKFDFENAEQQTVAIEFLNDLGIVLHFNQLRMSNFFVLDPYWVTTGVYRIITSNFAATKYGEIRVDDLDFIVNKEERKKEAYWNDKQRELRYNDSELCYLSEIMAEFRLSYFAENREKILIPDLLKAETPAQSVDSILENTDRLNLVYQYNYLPPSIIHLLMIDMKKDIEDAWRTGIILNYRADKEAQAVVMASNNQIRIAVVGNYRQKRDYLSIIRFFLDKTNDKYNLKPELLIPLPGEKDKFVEYLVLSAMDQDNKIVYKDYKLNKEFNISNLLTGIIENEFIRQQASTINNIYVTGNDNTILQTVQGSNVRIDKSGNLKKEDLETLREWLSSEFDRLLNGQETILHKLDSNYQNIMRELKSKGKDTQRIAEIIENINNQKEQTIIEVGQNIVEHINWAFENHLSVFTDEMNESLANLNKTDTWTTKIKFSFPLLDLLGVNLVHEVKLNKYLKWIYETF